MVIFRYILLGLFMGLSCTGHSQRSLWSEVSLNKKSVYQGEPIEVTVSVYTATWFTKGVNVQNIQVNNAFTVYFRSLSTSKVIDGKTYAGVQFFYNVFPYTSNNVVFPSLNISVETPNEGDYKGLKRTVKTSSKTITVKPIPSSFDPNQWLVTNNCTVKNHWNSSLKNVKVGDVIERSIYRSASGTVSELIPPVVWDSISGVSLYPNRSETNNHKSKTDISADRTDKMRYLFEKEGEIEFPEMTFFWWNPVHKKLYKKTLPKVIIEVAANPDLGIVTSIKDSLNAQVQVSEENTADEVFLLWGSPVDEWLKRILVAVITWILVVRIIAPIFNKIGMKYAQYQGSERYYFNQIIWAKLGWNSRNLKSIQYRWLDELKLHEPSLTSFWNQYGNKQPESILGWWSARKRYFATLQKNKNSDWINPV
ncbi:MAG: BatD family protein [Salibacteraceae bacterium]